MKIENPTAVRQSVINNLNASNSKRMCRFEHACYEDAINFVMEIEDSDIEVIFSWDDHELEMIQKICLNGAKDAKQYSYGGCGLIWNRDIAKHYCTPSVYKKKKRGILPPSKDANWCDVQADAIRRAIWKIYVAVRNVKQIMRMHGNNIFVIH